MTMMQDAAPDIRPGVIPDIIPDIIKETGLSEEAFFGRVEYIHAVRDGIPGCVVKNVVNTFNNRDLIVRILNTSSGNLSRYYRIKHMSRADSEEILDTVRLYKQAIETFGDKDEALAWIKSPVAALAGETPENLFDTFEGRQWVAQLLRKIEYGEFT